MIFTNLAGLLVLITALIVMFLLVPLKQIKDLLIVGLVGGLGVAIVLIYLMQNVFGYWVYRSVDFIYVSKIPVLLSAAWIPCIIAFSYLIIKYKQFLTRASLIIAFPLGGLLIHHLLITNQMLEYNNWNLILTFLVSVAIHAGIFAYLYLTKQLKIITN